MVTTNSGSYLTRLLSMREKRKNASAISSFLPVLAANPPPPTCLPDLCCTSVCSNCLPSFSNCPYLRLSPNAKFPNVSTSPRTKSTSPHRTTIFSVLLLVLTLLIVPDCNASGSSSSLNPLQVPHQQRSILSSCLFGTKPVNINDADDSSFFQLEPPQIQPVSEDSFSNFILKTKTSLAKFIHVAVVANLSSNVLALHESKINVTIADVGGGAKAEPIYQRYCTMSNQVVPMYSWLLSIDTNKVGYIANSTTTWQISWQGPIIGRNYSVQLHVFTVNRDRSMVSYLNANSSIHGITIDYDCDSFTVEGKPIQPWNPTKSHIQVTATPLFPSLFDGRPTTTLTIEDVSKQIGIQGFLIACAPWNWTAHSVQVQNAFGKWYLADDGSTMARRSECAYSSYREFDRRRKFLVKLMYSPPTVDGEPESDIVNEQIDCMALVVLGDGLAYLVYPSSPITEARLTTTVRTTRPTTTTTEATTTTETTTELAPTTTAEVTTIATETTVVVTEQSTSSSEVEQSPTTSAVEYETISNDGTHVIGFIETNSTTGLVDDITNETITIMVIDGSQQGPLIGNLTLTTVPPQTQQPEISNAEDVTTISMIETPAESGESDEVEMTDYDCLTMTVIGSNSTPKYLINEADTIDGTGKTYEEAGPFAITFVPANISNNQELSVIVLTLEPDEFFRGFFVKCGTRELMRDTRSSEQVDPESAAMYLTGYRSEPVDQCNFTGAAAKQTDMKPKVEQILFITLPRYQRNSDIVITCWATVVVNISEYWIISSSIPLIRRNSNEIPVMTEVVTVTETTPEMVPTTPEAVSLQSVTAETAATTHATVEVVDCSAMALFENHGSSNSVISTTGDEVFFNFSSTMALLPYGFITGTLVFGDELPPLIAAYLFGCMSATASPANFSGDMFGIVHEVTTPELENNDNVLTLPSWCGENYRQENAYFAKSTRNIHFAWHLPETVDATSGICRVVVLLTNGSYILRQSPLIEIVHPVVNEAPTTPQPAIEETPTSAIDTDMLYGFPSSMSCSYVTSTLLSPQRFRDCLDCSNKVAALEFVESSVKLGGNMTLGIVSADSEFVISDYILSCYVESTGEPVGKFYEAPIQANLLPSLKDTTDSVPVRCKNGVVRNRDVGPVYHVFYVWSLPDWIPFSAKQLRCSVLFPALPYETLVIVDSFPLRRVGPNYEIPASATMKPHIDDLQLIATTTTTMKPLLPPTTLMGFRIVSRGSMGENGLEPATAEPHSRFKYDCFEFAVRLPEESNKNKWVSPYTLYVSSTEFHDGQSLHLVVNSTDPEKHPFRGFMVLCAHVFGSDAEAAFKPDAPAGRLVEALVDSRVQSAAGGCGSRVEVSARQLKSSIAFLWMAPIFSEFPVQCRAIVVEDERNYWILNGPLMNTAKTTTQPTTTGTAKSIASETTAAVETASDTSSSDNSSSSSKPKKVIVITMDSLRSISNSSDVSPTSNVTQSAILESTTVEATTQPAVMSSGEFPIEELVKPTIQELVNAQKVSAEIESTLVVDEDLASEDLIEVSSPAIPSVSPSATGEFVEGSGASLADNQVQQVAETDHQDVVEIEQPHAAPPSGFQVEEEPIAIEIFQPNPIAAEVIVQNDDNGTTTKQKSDPDEMPSPIFFSRGFDCRRDGHVCRHGGDPDAKCDRFTGKCLCSRPSFSGYDCSITEVMAHSGCNKGRGCSNGGVCGRLVVDKVSPFGDDVISVPTEKCFCPYDFIGDDCETPRVSAQCDNLKGMRIHVVPFSNDNRHTQSTFVGSVRIVSTLNKTMSPSSGKNGAVLTSAFLSNETDCSFQRLPGSSGLYVLDRPFSFLVERCGAQMNENNTIYVQFMIQYSAFDMLTAFDPVYLVYCDLNSPRSAPAATPEPLVLLNAKKKKYERKQMQQPKMVASRLSSSNNRVQMTFTSKVAVSSSLDSLPRQVVVGMANSTRLYQTGAGQTALEHFRHNMSFIIRKRSVVSGGRNNRTAGQSVSAEEIRLSDILEIEISNYDTSYFKYIYLDECRVEFDQSRQPGAILVADGCPTATVRRYLVDWMTAADDLSNGELLNSAVGVASSESPASASFSYSAFWPRDSRALSFNCSVNLCGVDMAEDCPQKVCPAIPGFTLRHKRRRRRDVAAEEAEAKRKRERERAERDKEWMQRKEGMMRAQAAGRKQEAMTVGQRRIEAVGQFIDAAWSAIWLTGIVIAYIAAIYFVMSCVRKINRYFSAPHDKKK